MFDDTYLNIEFSLPRSRGKIEFAHKELRDFVTRTADLLGRPTTTQSWTPGSMKWSSLMCTSCHWRQMQLLKTCLPKSMMREIVTCIHQDVTRNQTLSRDDNRIGDVGTMEGLKYHMRVPEGYEGCLPALCKSRNMQSLLARAGFCLVGPICSAKAQLDHIKA